MLTKLTWQRKGGGVEHILALLTKGEGGRGPILTLADKGGGVSGPPLFG